MKSDQQCVAKGFYKYPQINNFISVKNYIFLRSKNKKYLLLQFVNDMNCSINFIKYTVVQIDVNGKVLKKTQTSSSLYSLAPGKSFVLKEAIAVDDYCADFKIIFSEADSNRYTYRIHNGEVVTYYNKKDSPIVNTALEQKRLYNLSVKQRKFGRPKLAVLLAIVILLALFVFNAYNILTKRSGYALNDGYTANGCEYSDLINVEEEIFTKV